MNRLVQLVPRFNNLLTQLADISMFLPTYFLLHYTLNFIVNWIKVNNCLESVRWSPEIPLQAAKSFRDLYELVHCPIGICNNLKIFDVWKRISMLLEYVIPPVYFLQFLCESENYFPLKYRRNKNGCFFWTQCTPESITEMLSKLGNRAAINTALDFHTFIDSFEFRSPAVQELDTIFTQQ